MKQIYLEKYNQNGYLLYRVPSIVVTDKGTVLVCYECRYGSDWAAMDLVVRRSTDGGNTWSERNFIASGKEIDAIHNGILFVDGNTIHLLYHKNYRELFHVKSVDDGFTWSEPKDISYAYRSIRNQYNWTVIAAGPGHGIVTSTGRMLVAVWVAKNRTDITSHHPSVVTTLYSDDHGETWQCGEIIWNHSDFVDPNESVLAELPDGRIMINCRHETLNNMRKIGFSPDGVSNWSDFYFEPQLTEPICAAGMTHNDKYIWFTHCAPESGFSRVNLCLHRTDDMGKTWKYITKLDDYGGYSDVFYDSRQNRLFVVAETGRENLENRDSFTFGISVIQVPSNEI